MIGAQINSHGVAETSPIDGGTKALMDRAEKRVLWDEPGLKVIRLRLLTERGYPCFDVSYCLGMLKGEPVWIDLPFHNLPRRGYKKAIISEAKAEGVYAKGLGLLEDHVLSVLW